MLCPHSSSHTMIELSSSIAPVRISPAKWSSASKIERSQGAGLYKSSEVPKFAPPKPSGVDKASRIWHWPWVHTAAHFSGTRKKGGEREDSEHTFKIHAHTLVLFPLDGLTGVRHQAWPRLTIAVVTIHSPAINTAGALEILTQTWKHVHIVHAHENPKLDAENRIMPERWDRASVWRRHHAYTRWECVNQANIWK